MSDQAHLDREKDWVEARLNCTVEAAFKMLVTIIKSDIEKYNELSGHRTYEADHVGDDRVIFKRANGDISSKVASLSVAGGRVMTASISINGTDISKFQIKPDWNKREMKCDLYIGDERVSMHRASQKIIGEVLFE